MMVLGYIIAGLFVAIIFVLGIGSVWLQLEEDRWRRSKRNERKR